MKKMKSVIALILVALCIFTIPATALSMDGGVQPLKALFVAGEGPVEDGYSVDYSY